MLETGAAENRKQRHAVCWREALSYKVHGTGEAYGPKDFDKILQNYSVGLSQFAPSLVDGQIF